MRRLRAAPGGAERNRAGFGLARRTARAVTGRAHAGLRPTVYFVVGMHRSGTSAVAASLGAMGVALGDELLAEPVEFNRRGYFEDLALSTICDRLLAAGNATWHSISATDPAVARPERYLELRDDAVRIIARRFSQVRQWAFKNPRVARQLPFWMDVARSAGHDARFVVCLRHPRAVARSLACRDGLESTDAWRLWLQHMLPAAGLVIAQRAPVVDFDDLIDEPSRCLRALASRLQLDGEGLEASLDHHLQTFLTPALRHHRAAERDDAVATRGLEQCCLALYERLARFGVLRHHAQADLNRLGAVVETARSVLGNDPDRVLPSTGDRRPAPAGNPIDVNRDAHLMDSSDETYACVAVVTRTRDRPLTLARVLRTLQDQTFRDFIWVVVNDGGALQPVEETVARARESGVAAVLVHHPQSKGRAAAANAGVAAVDSRYIVWLDDDDSWHPGFLAKAVDFLEDNRDRFKGVVTGCEVVLERQVGDEIVEVGREAYPMPAGGDSVPVVTLMAGNPFPPVCFVFDRATGLACGRYDERLDLWEDWEFNTRFVLRGEIGLLRETLACYHQREASDDGTYDNTKTYRYSGPLLTFQVWQDRELRKAVDAGQLSRGVLLYLGELKRDAVRVDERLTASERLSAALTEAVNGSTHHLAGVLQAMSQQAEHRARDLAARAKSAGHVLDVLQGAAKSLGYDVSLLQDASKSLDFRLSRVQELAKGIDHQLAEQVELSKGFDHRLAVVQDASKTLDFRLSVLQESARGVEHRLAVQAESAKALDHRLSVLAEQANGMDYRLSVLLAHASQLDEGQRQIQAQLASVVAMQREAAAAGRADSERLSAENRRLQNDVAELQRMVQPIHAVAAKIYRVTGLRWLRNRLS